MITIGKCFGEKCLVYNGIGNREGYSTIMWISKHEHWVIVPSAYITIKD